MRYEYKTLPIENSEFDNSCKGLISKLNEIGKSNWELVSIITHHGIGGSPYNIIGITQKQFLLLKRPLLQKVTK